MIPRSRPPQTGITLIEVLIALLVLSIGLLGLASLYISSVRLTHDSQLRAIASIKAEDMNEHIRITGAPGTYLAEWRDNIATLLPNGDGSVNDAGNHFAITITWTDRGTRLEEGALEPGLTRSFEYRAWKAP